MQKKKVNNGASMTVSHLYFSKGEVCYLCHEERRLFQVGEHSYCSNCKPTQSRAKKNIKQVKPQALKAIISQRPIAIKKTNTNHSRQIPNSNPIVRSKKSDIEKGISTKDFPPLLAPGTYFIIQNNRIVGNLIGYHSQEEAARVSASMQNSGLFPHLIIFHAPNRASMERILSYNNKNL